MKHKKKLINFCEISLLWILLFTLISSIIDNLRMAKAYISFNEVDINFLLQFLINFRLETIQVIISAGFLLLCLIMKKKEG